MENTELEAQNMLQMETNEKLESLEKIGEASLVELDGVKEAVKDLETSLEVIALNTEKKEVQQVELKGISVVTLKGDKGEKGDKGDQGEKGDKGDTGPAGQDSTIPGPKGEKGDQGMPGKDGEDGKDGRDGRDGRDGEDGKDGKDGKDGSPDTPEQIAEKVNTLSKQIDFKVLKNVPDNLGGKNLGRGGYLREVSDVAVENITNGQAIRWNSTTNLWEPYTPTDVPGVQTVTGLNTDNTDPLNPIIGIAVDEVTITGSGTPGDPLVSLAGGFSGTEGSVPFVDTDGTLTENNDNFFWDNTNVQLRVGTVDDVYSESSLDPLLVTDEVDDYHAITIRNRSNGTSASADLVVSNDLDDGGIETGVYGNLGIVSSTYTRGGAELVQPNDTYLEAFGGNLLIQANNAGKTVDITTGGDLITNLRTRFSDSLTQFFANYDTDITPAFTGGNWTGTNGWSVSGGNLVLASNASDGTMQPATPLTIGVGTTYKITITTSAVSGTVTYTLGGVSGSAITGATTENFITALTTDNFIITGLAGSTATITEITILPLIDDTGDVLIEGNLTIGSTLKTLSNEDVLNIDGDGAVTFPNYLPFGPNGVSPTQDYHLVTKLYADTLFSSGARFVDDVRAGTTTALPACTYNNGTSGVGATLTGDANGALSAQDGVTLTVDQMLLVKNQANQAHNGVYVLTQVGDGSNPFILTRLGTYDSTAEIVTGTFFTILAGNTLALSQWSMNNDASITVGTTDITFAQLSAPLTYTGGDGIDVTSTTISVDLASTPGLEFNTNQLRVYSDETTIERSASGIRVKDGGITAAKLVGGGVPETPTGDVDGVNDTFTVTRTPLYININGLNYYENSGYTLSGLTITLDSVLIPPTGSIIRSHYV